MSMLQLQEPIGNSKVLESQNPQNKEEWLECVVQAHVKNQMIQSYGFTPSQRVFGKHPDIPGDLLNEPQPIIPNTGSLHDDSIARAYAIRTSARKAVLELQDDRILRRAMLARPRLFLVILWHTGGIKSGTKAFCQKGESGMAVVLSWV